MELSDFDRMLMEKLHRDDSIREKYPNVYPISRLDMANEHLCLKEKVGVAATYMFLKDATFASEYITEELLRQAQMLTISTEKDAFVLKCDIQEDLPSYSVRFQLRLLMLGDVEIAYAYDPHVGEFRYSRNGMTV